MLACANRSRAAFLSKAPRARATESRRGLATRGEQRAPLPTHQYFQPSAKLTEQRKSHPGLHYIFLEGVGGSGKGSLLGRLSKIGYSTMSLPYVQFCSTMWHSTHFAPNSATVGMFWLSEWTKQLELVQYAHKQGKQHKDNVMFVQRSPLTLWVHDLSRLQPPSRTNVWLRVNDEIKQQFSSSTILCYSDTIRTKERLAERMYWAENEPKAIRTTLHEEEQDLQQLFEDKYKELQDKELFDGAVATTDSKQACAEILTLYGLNNWESFKEGLTGSKPL